MANGTVRKIHPNKYSRNGNIFTRIEFIMDNGTWAKTDVCPDYRNYVRWVKVIQSGVGTQVDNLTMRNKSEVNGDSFPKITGKQPEMVGSQPEIETKPKDTQGALFD